MIGLALLAQLAVVANAPDTGTTCAPIELTVAARVPGTVAPAIAPPATTAMFQLLRSTILTRVEGSPGRPSAVTEATFLLATPSAGRLSLPPVIVSSGTETAKASAGTIAMRSGSAGGTGAPLVIVRASLQASEGARGDSLYVGQQVDYVVDVQLNDAARQRLRRNPTFFPPEMPGVLAYDIAKPIAPLNSARRCFATLSYRRALFPLFAGRTAIAPATLTYSLPLSNSFFSREESFELRTDSVSFVARDVPSSGRTAEFAGAVGDLAVSTRVSSARGRMGDPVVLTLRVAGTGNVKLWPRPVLAVPWAATALAGERVSVDSGNARIRGAKEFEWLLTPREAGRLEVPPIRYQFFDPARGAFRESASAPVAIDVSSAALAAVDSAGPARLSLRRTLGEATGAPLTTRGWFWFLLAFAPVPAAGRRLAAARTRSRAVSARQQLRASAAGSEVSPRRVRRLYLDSIRERVGALASQESAPALSRTLRRAGVTERVAESAAALLHELDVASFASVGGQNDGFALRAERVLAAIDAEAVRDRPARVGERATRGARGFTALAFVALTSIIAGAAPLSNDAMYGEGIRAYDAGNFGAAGESFAKVATRVPSSGNAWMSLGAASWARGDTASAVRAWQRALRLSPLDDEARQHLALVQAMPVRSAGFVAPVPSLPVGIAALALWLAVWIALAVPSARRPWWARRAIAPGVAVSVALLVLAVRLDRGLSPRGLAVVRRSRALEQSPGSTSAAGNAATGEVARLGQREGSWVLVHLDGQRAGWVPLAAMLPLDAPPIGD